MVQNKLRRGNVKKLIGILSLFVLLPLSNLQAQTNTCSGTWTSVTNDCQNFTIGDGTAGFIKICFDVNNIPTGGGSSCNPGGACNPPYGGGGWAPRIAIYDSGGNLIDNIIATTAVGDCFFVPVNDGLAEIYGLCLTAGTQISWETVDECGNDVCSGSPPPCNPPGSCDCANPCGPACGWATPPTVAQVTANCTQYPYLPEIGPFEVGSTSCYTFVAASTSVDFNVIITSDCGGGNVSNFTYETYATGSCVTPVWTGNLSNLTMSPTVIGQSYTFCYTFDTPGCTHTSHYPYFVGASALPIVFKDFYATPNSEQINLQWEIESEEGVQLYLVESSTDGNNFEALTIVESSGSSTYKKYNTVDPSPSIGMNYYRLTKIDEGGGAKVLKTINVTFSGNEYFNAEFINIYNLGGALIETVNVQGQDVHNKLSNMDLNSGFYIIEMVDIAGNLESFKYFKQNNF